MTQPRLARVPLRTGTSPSAREVRSGTQRAKPQQTHPAQSFLQRHKHERVISSCVLRAPPKEELNRCHRQLLAGRMKALQSPAEAPSRHPRNGVTGAGKHRPAPPPPHPPPRRTGPGSSSGTGALGAARGSTDRASRPAPARPLVCSPAPLAQLAVLVFNSFWQPVTVTRSFAF